jgi:hypothetical protein
MAKTFKLGAKDNAVKIIQQVLNKDLRLDLKENGVFDTATFDAVKAFQKKHSLRPIDGVIGETTGIQLNEVSGDKLEGIFPTAKEAEIARRKKAGIAVIPPDGHTSRSSFVGSKVRLDSMSTSIIDKIYPYFPKKYTVISAYLSEGQCYWKINWHWDLMRTWLEYAKDHKLMSAQEQVELNDMHKKLMSNKPSKLGHYKIDTIGEPDDDSPLSKIVQRHAILKGIKKELMAYSEKQGFTSRKLQNMEQLKMAVQPVALPTESNHPKGWAIDIAGNVSDIAKIAKSLGATLAFQEHPHCHCEWRGGKVDLPPEID